ncbi:putative 2OG-Fe(II) oxygenase [Tsuneonella sp. SYSU-LHT278]|uniref:putative 2OG-Fe(II) oxygenase n=1 Tax=Tsuneonella sediminis TaxID=3416089 RepID=UPI003F78F05C
MDETEARQLLARLPRSDPSAAFAAGLELLRQDYPELLQPAARSLVRKYPRDHRLHQLAGLAARAAGDSRGALDSFAKAATLAPADPLIAHSHARTALEAGEPSLDLFERAAALAPADGSVLLGLCAALVHKGRAAEAIERLERLVAANPEWLDGHRDLARIRGQMGLDPLAALDAAIISAPRSEHLHRMRITLALEARDLDAADAAIASARASLPAARWLDLLAAHVASERGDLSRADAMFEGFDCSTSAEDASLYARHLVRANRPAIASALLEPLIVRDSGHHLWPYLSLAWRMAGDPRWQWLEGDPGLVSVHDIGTAAGDLETLATHLRALHFATHPPLDQSVRGGTQTDGNLLLRLDPPIRRLRRALTAAFDRHVDKLPRAVSGHPTLIERRKPRRIAGAWSVRLTDRGFHADHVHSEGWYSSVFYVGLPASQSPEGGSGERHAGWLSLGECRDLAPQLAPVRLVEPRPGRLVLFPSTMWHGTRAFPEGERLTVAFDIARPRQQ